MHFLIACLSAVREEERKRGGDKTGWGLTHLVILARGRSKLGLVEGGHTHTHTHTQTHTSFTHTFKYTHQTNRQQCKYALIYPQETHNLFTHRHKLSQIIHLFRGGWVRLRKYSRTGPAHAPFNTSEWVIGCANGQCSHLFNRLWTVFHRGGCTTLHTGRTPIRLHYITSPASHTSCQLVFPDCVVPIMTVILGHLRCQAASTQTVRCQMVRQQEDRK